MPLYNHLKEHRARLGLNQQQLGALVGASRQTISLIERRLLSFRYLGSENCQSL